MTARTVDGGLLSRRSGGRVDPVLAHYPYADAFNLLTLPGLLAYAASRHGARDFVIEPDRITSIGEIAEASRRVRDELIERGFAQGTRVGILLPNGADFIAAFFGIERAGCVAVLLNTLWTESEVAATIERVGVAGVIGDGRPAGSIPQLHVGEILACRATADAHADVDVAPDDEAVVLFTSGSTGLPKAVVHRHRAPCLQGLRWGHLLELGPNEVLLSTSPYFWSSGLAKSMLSCMATGASLVAVPAFTPRLALDLMERHRVTTLISPLHLDHQILDEPGFSSRDLTQLRRIHSRSPLKEALGLDATWDPGGYGLSEMFTLASSFRAGTPIPDRAGSEGWVLPGVEVKITDPESGRVVPLGEIGSICVKGESLMIGYDAAETVLDDEGFFRTADMGELDDEGRLYFRGRSDSIIRSGGTNLSPAEIDSALQGWSKVRRSAVVAVPHPTRQQVLVLGVVPNDPALTTDEVRAYLRERLAAYKLPRRIVFLSVEEIRHTATHKVDLAHVRSLIVDQLSRTEADQDWRSMLVHEADR